jgi:hypothetical protein
MAKCLQSQSFKAFTEEKLSDVTIHTLSLFMDQVMVFLETVEHQTVGINTFIRKLHQCTFTRGHATDEQSIALIAQEHY